MDPNALLNQNQPSNLPQGILNMFASPMTQGIAQGLLAASGPSSTPQGWGPALAAGMQAGQQLQQVQAKQTLADALLNQKVQSMMMKSPLIQAQTALDQQKAAGNVGVAGIAGQIAAANRLAAQGNTDQASTIMNGVRAQIASLQGNAAYRGANTEFKYVPKALVENVVSQTGLPNTQGVNVVNGQLVTQGSGAPRNALSAPMTSPVAAMDTSTDAPPSQQDPSESAADTEDSNAQPLNQTEIKAAASAAQMSPQQVKQVNRATSADQFYNLLGQKMDALQKFSTYGGRLDQLSQQQASSLGFSEPDYQNLQEAKQDIQVLAKEMQGALTGQATDAESAAMKALADPSFEGRNPGQVLALYQNLGDILNQQKKAIVQNPAQQLVGLQNTATAAPQTAIAPPTSSGFDITALLAEKARRQKAGLM